MTLIDTDHAAERNGYLTTTGRITGRPHEIEIWFGTDAAGDRIFLLSGGGDRSDWVRNIAASPEVSFRVRETTFRGRARRATAAEDPDARMALARKYYGHTAPDQMNDWARTALPLVIDIDRS